MRYGVSPFELFYEVKPRLLPTDSGIDEDTSIGRQKVELLAIGVPRASRADNKINPQKINDEERRYQD